MIRIFLTIIFKNFILFFYAHPYFFQNRPIINEI